MDFVFNLDAVLQALLVVVMFVAGAIAFVIFAWMVLTIHEANCRRDINYLPDGRRDDS